MGWRSTLWTRTRALWEAAKNERATPRQIGWAVAVGCFVGCSPALGFHGGIALAAATIFRLNRMFCWLGSRSSNIFILPFLASAEVEVAHLLRTGEWLTLEREHLIEHAKGFLLDWTLGMIPVGVPFSALLGLAAYAWKRRAVARARAKDEAHLQGGGRQEQ